MAGRIPLRVTWLNLAKKSKKSLEGVVFERSEARDKEFVI